VTTIAVFEIKKLVAFSWPLSLSQLLSLGNLGVDTIMLGQFGGSSDVGIYAAAQTTALLGSLVLISFRSIFAPMISDLHSRGNFRYLSDYFKTVAKWIFTLNFPLFILLIVFAKPIMAVFGSQFTLGYSSLMVLSFGWLMLSSAGLVGNFLTMLGKSKLNLTNTFCMLSTNILLNLWFIPHYGMLGAAIATAIAMGVVSAMSLIELKILFNIHPYRSDFLKPFIAGGTSGIVIFFLKESLFASLKFCYFQLVIGSVLFVSLYLAMLAFLGIEKGDAIILERIKERLRL
jgi:O-antigen/teichoic acid export membrane protein